MNPAKRPMLYIAASFCVGISLSRLLDIPFLYLAAASLIFILLSLPFLKRKIISHIFLYLALASFGYAYQQNYNTLPINHISNFISDGGRAASIRGVVSDEPVKAKAFYGKERTALTLKVSGLSYGVLSLDSTGLVRITLYSENGDLPIGLGDEIVVSGRLSKPLSYKNAGIFDYSDYLKIKGIHAVMTVKDPGSIRIVDKARLNFIRLKSFLLREKINGAITRYTDSSSSPFLRAILTGSRSGMDDAVMEDFIKTGTVHVIAISGLNIVLIAGIFIFLLRLFGIRKKLNLIITSALLVFYCFVAGASPPVIRATMMFIIVSLGYVISRESDIINSVSTAAFAMLIINPNELFDPSFQLSFLSILGIVLFSGRIESMLGGGSNYIVKGMAVSIAAILFVWPLVARYFNIISPIAIMANLVIVPALFLITVVSFILLGLSFLGLDTIAVYIGYLLSALVHITFYINHIFAQIPFSFIRIGSPSILFLSLYYVFTPLLLFLKRKRQLFIIILIAANIAIWKDVFSHNSNELKITFIDVGRGDSILLEFPDGKSMLIDAGPGGIEGLFDAGRSIVAPFLWNKGIKKIDALLITHFHSDHMGGALYLLDNFDVGCAMDAGAAPGSEMRLYNKYRKIIFKKNFRRLKIAQGDEILGYAGVRIFILNPPEDKPVSDANNGSIALRLEYRNFSALFCADIGSRAMENMFKYGRLLRSDILKIPHHGGSVGDKVIARNFFENVSASVFIISSGDIFNSEPFLFQHLNHPGSALYNTREDGAIEVVTDGISFKVAHKIK